MERSFGCQNDGIVIAWIRRAAVRRVRYDARLVGMVATARRPSTRTDKIKNRKTDQFQCFQEYRLGLRRLILNLRLGPRTFGREKRREVRAPDSREKIVASSAEVRTPAPVTSPPYLDLLDLNFDLTPQRAAVRAYARTTQSTRFAQCNGGSCDGFSLLYETLRKSKI